MTTRLNIALLVLALLIGLPFYWLFLENPASDVQPYPLTITQLRALAAAEPGPRPEAIDLHLAGWRRLPGNFLAAGSGMKRRLYGVMSFSLTTPGQAPIVIDSGTTAPLAAKLQLEHLVESQQAAINGQLNQARLFLATAEDPDHLGGLAGFAARPESGIALTRARLNPFQVPSESADDGVDWPPNLVLRAGFAGTRPFPIAPGIVVIPAAGHSPGSQMIFVTLASGREYLFAGDVSPMTLNWQRLRLKSRFFARLSHAEDRPTLMRWLVTIAALKRADPALVIVPGHDYDWISNPANHTGIAVR